MTIDRIRFDNPVSAWNIKPETFDFPGLYVKALPISPAYSKLSVTTYKSSDPHSEVTLNVEEWTSENEARLIELVQEFNQSPRESWLKLLESVILPKYLAAVRNAPDPETSFVVQDWLRLYKGFFGTPRPASLPEVIAALESAPEDSSTLSNHVRYDITADALNYLREYAKTL